MLSLSLFLSTSLLSCFASTPLFYVYYRDSKYGLLCCLSTINKRLGLYVIRNSFGIFRIMRICILRAYHRFIQPSIGLSLLMGNTNTDSIRVNECVKIFLLKLTCCCHFFFFFCNQIKHKFLILIYSYF